MDSEDIKAFYREHHDTIRDKRAESPHALRRYVHAMQYESVAQFVQSETKVLDVGCGDGVLSVLMARKGAVVTGCDFSEPNIEAARTYAAKHDVANAQFLVADADYLPFPDNSFDLVVSSHVLEHLPDFDQGLREIMRVTKKRAIIAIPTVLNLCSLVQVGGGWFWLKGPRSFFALLYGFLRLLNALLRGDEGVDESYAGHDVPHVFRFPGVVKSKVQRLGFRLVSHEADSLCLPYFSTLLPLLRWMNRRRDAPVLRTMGYGTLYVIEK